MAMLSTPMQTPLLPPARITLPILVLGGYAALLITGYDTQLGTVRALPLYAYLCILLLVLQIAISRQRSVLRVFYVLVSSAFAILYAGERAFGPQTNGNFTKSPYTYIVINTLLLIVFVVDVIGRRLDRRGSAATPGGAQSTIGTQASSRRVRRPRHGFRWARHSVLSLMVHPRPPGASDHPPCLRPRECDPIRDGRSSADSGAFQPTGEHRAPPRP